MIIWLNGTFGAGKTTTGRLLTGLLPNARLVDAEEVGYLLLRLLGDHPVRDFQDLAPWRELVPVVTARLAAFTGQDLIAVQSVLRADYWAELGRGFQSEGLDVFHVLLHVEPDQLAARIRADKVDAGACQWRLDHMAAYQRSRPWLERAADLVVDATAAPPAAVAERVAGAVAARAVRSAPDGR